VAASKPLDAGIPDATVISITASTNSNDSTEATMGTATLTFKVTPGSAQDVEIEVDGVAVTGMTHTVDLEGATKRVTVIAKARGFRTWKKVYSLRRDIIVKVRLARPSTRGRGPGGLIDL
jgi:hypothetical protein